MSLCSLEKDVFLATWATRHVGIYINYCFKIIWKGYYQPLSEPITISSKDKYNFSDSKVHGANMGPILGRQDPGGPHVGPMNFAIWAS